jgi:hypothetical protein
MTEHKLPHQNEGKLFQCFGDLHMLHGKTSNVGNFTVRKGVRKIQYGNSTFLLTLTVLSMVY